MVSMAQTRRRVRQVGVYVPVLVGLAVLLVIALWYPRLADPVATHWDPVQPDGFTNKAAFLFIGPAIVILSSIPMAVIALLMKTWGQPHRVLVSLYAGLSVLLGGVVLNIARASYALADGEIAPSPSLLIPALLALAVWAGAFLVLPAPITGPDVPSTTLAPAQTSNPEFSALVFPDSPILIFLGISMIPSLIISAWAIGTDRGAAIILGLILVGSLLILTGLLVFRIRITPAGFFARSIFGWPRIKVPADTITSVEVQPIDPLGDFGGWGIRWMGRKRIGLVFKEGPGLMITGHDGRVVGVTLDNAEEAGAALLSAVHTDT